MTFAICSNEDKLNRVVCVSVNHLHLHDVSMTWFEQKLNKKFKGNEMNFDQEISFKQKGLITFLIWNWKGWKLKASKSSNILYCRKLHEDLPKGPQ
jgi:hypothetical protein